MVLSSLEALSTHSTWNITEECKSTEGKLQFVKLHFKETCEFKSIIMETS